MRYAICMEFVTSCMSCHSINFSSMICYSTSIELAYSKLMVAFIDYLKYIESIDMILKLTKLITSLIAVMIMTGCMPAEVEVKTPQGKLKVMFYPGGSVLQDLIIIQGKNYFGTAQYQMDDALADIGFRFADGTRVQAECSSAGKDIIGQPECKIYTVYRSSFALIPAGSVVPKPALF